MKFAPHSAALGLTALTTIGLLLPVGAEFAASATQRHLGFASAADVSFTTPTTIDASLATAGVAVSTADPSVATASTPDSVFALTSPAVGEVTTNPLPVFTGTATPLATVEIRDGSGALLGTTRALLDGAWTLTWDRAVAPGAYTGGTVREIVGGVERNRAGYDFTVARIPFEVTSPTVGGTLTSLLPVFSGTAAPYSRVEILSPSGDLLGSASAARDGSWRIVWNGFVTPGRHSGGTVRESIDGTETGRITYDFTAERVPFELTAPAVGGTITTPKPVFSGTALPAARIEIQDASGDVLTSTLAKPDGNWSITWKTAVAPGTTLDGVVREVVDGTETGRTDYDFTVVR